MDDLFILCYFISAVLAMLFSTTFYKCVIYSARNSLTQEDPSQKENIEGFTDGLNLHVRSILMFNGIAMIVLPITFYILYVMQNTTFLDLIHLSIIHASGIYVPIVLLLSGCIIRSCFFKIVKEQNDFDESMMKEVIIHVALACNVALVPFDMTFGLFVLAIILGKYIWIDFVYNIDSFHDRLKKIWNHYKKMESPVILSKGYSILFLYYIYSNFCIYWICIYKWNTGIELAKHRVLLILFTNISVTLCLIIWLRRKLIKGRNT